MWKSCLVRAMGTKLSTSRNSVAHHVGTLFGESMNSVANHVRSLFSQIMGYKIVNQQDQCCKSCGNLVLVTAQVQSCQLVRNTLVPLGSSMQVCQQQRYFPLLCTRFVQSIIFLNSTILVHTNINLEQNPLGILFCSYHNKLREFCIVQIGGILHIQHNFRLYHEPGDYISIKALP